MNLKLKHLHELDLLDAKERELGFMTVKLTRLLME